MGRGIMARRKDQQSAIGAVSPDTRHRLASWVRSGVHAHGWFRSLLPFAEGVVNHLSDCP